MLRDFNTEWLEKRVFIPWNSMTGIYRANATPATYVQNQKYEFVGQGGNTNIGTQVAASFAAGLAIAAQNDGASHLWMAPFDLDIKKALRFRVHYTQTATSGTVTWQIKYSAIVATQAGTAGATVIAVAGTALDTVIPAASGTVVANDYRVTDFGQINRGTIPDTSDAIIMQVICTDAAPVAGLKLLGTELRYTPRRMAGPRRNILGGRRLRTSQPLGTILATTQEGL